MVKYFQWDYEGYLIGEIEVDESGPLPVRSTDKTPPELVGAQVARWTGFSWELLPSKPEPIPAAVSREEMSALVDVERDRRINAGVMFEGKLYQSGSSDRENVTGAVVIALSDPSYTQNWIASDNSVTQMSNATLIAFGKAMAANKEALIFAGRALKDMPEIPLDYADDKYWPAQ